MHPLRFSNSGIRAKQLAAKVGAACGGGAATYMLSASRGGWPRPGPLQGRPAMAWLPARDGRLQPRPPTWGGSQGPADNSQPARGCRPGPALPPVGRLPAAKGSRRLRRGSDGGGAVRVKEG
ncbi:hypothetical protein BHM03_00026811 [Ensete ventricosum]|nr:hypothetical protein BHM03_00026811 [Ensete ventricosum]